MPAQMPFFEAVAQIIPVLILGVVIGGRVLTRHTVLFTAPMMGGVSLLVLGETACLYVLATGTPGVLTTWLTLVSLAGGVLAVGDEVLRPAMVAQVEEFETQEQGRRQTRTWSATQRASWVLSFLIAALTFVALPVVVVIAATVLAIVR